MINTPDTFVDEFVEGTLLAHPDVVKTTGDDRRVLVRADAPVAGKVGIVTGGGSSHLPLFKGCSGAGHSLADVATIAQAVTDNIGPWGLGCPRRSC